MADIFLICVIVVGFFLLTVVGLYFVVKYQHPDDKNDAYIPKLVVLLGFVLAGGTVFLLPLDVANNSNFAGCEGFNTAVCGGLNMVLFWDIIYWLIPAWVFILIPFCIFYYEADDGMLMAGTSVGAKPKSKLKEALCYESFVVVIFGLIFAMTYLFMNSTSIPVRDWTGPDFAAGPLYSIGEEFNSTFSADQLSNMQTGDVAILNANTVNSEMSTIELSINPATFYAGLMAWMGWFLFACFGGIGMAALPLDLILAFVNRPHHMDAVEFAEAQRSLRDRVNELVNVGELLKIEQEENAQKYDKMGWREKRKAMAEEKKTWIKFKQAVYLMEEDAEEFANCTANYRNYNPLIPIFSLLGGIVALIISLCWVLQIILYMLPTPPVTPFLNQYFRWFESWFNLLGVMSVAIFSFYLLICAVKGCFKFGLRFLFFQVHPMKLNKTYMSSFLFNIGLVLLCALPVVQFSASAFQDYARYTTVNQTFNVQLYYLKFFGWFWGSKVFEYALLVILLLTCIYLGCKPKDTSGGKDSISLRDRLRARVSG
eukprot:CAMPEP_0201686634 /NCGR_PEP_ID=MMETSP0578-20130828/1004_1 /ASSEMBLY_ACC=CAM_ASM_000663 /TAXON_ID=267565 /ORGANISM="Skeletonema grethea, Strain CCMP 1804" /LENGTH=540 /DNA_ID=CAMNT_0048170711 /DNA_START=67 /DNA_END=1689 /DNA_ORIENTATION=-